MNHEEHAHRDPREFWEELYGGDNPWSGKVNALLASELHDRPLPVSTALDLGCGTGGDAIWLASEGWKVTGVDISTGALAKAEAAADKIGVQVDWVHADLGEAFPEGSWDLISASYLHSPTALAREQVLADAVAALAPGGTLVVTSHLRGPSWHETKHTGMPTIEEVIESVHLEGTELEHAEVVEVLCTSPEGVQGFKVDTIVRVRRA
jgi:SAM-dependent methyltransferase